MKKVNILLILAALVSLVAMLFGGCASGYTLSTSISPAGGGYVSPASGTYDKDVEVLITATPATGYRFDHWEGAAAINSPTLHLYMDGNKRVTALFVKTYTLSVSSTPTGTGTISPNGGTYDSGAQATLVATPAEFYKFDGWEGDASGSTNPLTITMNSDKTIVASFSKASYSLQAQAEPLGGGAVQPSSGTYEGGTNVTVVAKPATGYRFNHWEGSATGSSATLGIVMDANKTLTAYFTRAYMLSISSTPEGSCTIVPGSGLYDVGTEVTVTATTVFPYALTSWSGTDNDSANPTTVIMDADKSVIAYCSRLTAGAQQTKSGVYRAYDVKIPITLNAGQWVQGGMTAERGIPLRILGPAYEVLEDLGTITTASFTFQAQTSGTYYINFPVSGTLYNPNYSIVYTIYS